MKTVASLKATFGMVEPEQKDENGNVLVPATDLDWAKGFSFYAVPIALFPNAENPVVAMFEEVNKPIADAPVFPAPELDEGEPAIKTHLPAYVQNMRAVADEEFIYVAAKGTDFPLGTLMRE